MLDRARAGDNQAMEALLRSLAPSIHRFGLKMCRHPADADDILQDTLLSVTENLQAFEGRSSLTSWVFALTRSACSRRRRGLKNQPPVDDPEHLERSDANANPERDAVERQLAARIDRALDGLPDDYREAILLRDVENLTAPEAADAIGISVAALKSRLHRARAALRAALEPIFEEPRPAKTGCPDILELWSRKMEDDLSPEDCATVEEHIENCEACAMTCDALRSALRACRNLTTDTVPESVQERIRSALSTWIEANRGGLMPQR